MIKNVQVWSHRDKEYLAPVSCRYKAKPQEIIYPRVSIASVFNENKTTFGVAVQHQDDVDNKTVGQEAAVENALMKPVLVLNEFCPISEKLFNDFAWSLYNLYFENLKPVSTRSMNEEEFLEVIENECDDCDCYCSCTDPDCCVEYI